MLDAAIRNVVYCDFSIIDVVAIVNRRAATVLAAVVPQPLKSLLDLFAIDCLIAQILCKNTETLVLGQVARLASDLLAVLEGGVVVEIVLEEVVHAAERLFAAYAVAGAAAV
jgi:hypothetical protein